MVAFNNYKEQIVHIWGGRQHSLGIKAHWQFLAKDDSLFLPVTCVIASLCGCKFSQRTPDWQNSSLLCTGPRKCA